MKIRNCKDIIMKLLSFSTVVMLFLSCSIVPVYAWDRTDVSEWGYFIRVELYNESGGLVAESETNVCTNEDGDVAGKGLPMEKNATVKWPSNYISPSKTGYYISGWSTTKGGNAIQYKSGQIINGNVYANLPMETFRGLINDYSGKILRLYPCWTQNLKDADVNELNSDRFSGVVLYDKGAGTGGKEMQNTTTKSFSNFESFKKSETKLSINTYQKVEEGKEYYFNGWKIEGTEMVVNPNENISGDTFIKYGSPTLNSSSNSADAVTTLKYTLKLVAQWVVNKEDVEYDNSSQIINPDGTTTTIHPDMQEIYDMAKVAYGSDAYSDILNYLSFSAPNEDASDKDNASSMWLMIEKIYSIVLPVGYALMLLYFLLDLLNKVTNDNFNLEHFFKSFLKLIIAVILLSNGLDLMKGLAEFAQAIASAVSGLNKDGIKAAGTEEISNKLTEWADICSTAHGSFARLGYKMSLMIPYYIKQGMKIVIWVIAFSRIFELGVRCCFLPIACADVFGEGTKGSGFRYLKKMLATLLQSAVIVVLIWSYTVIISQVNTALTSVDPFITQVVGALSLIMLLFKSQNLASDIVGV